MIKSAKYLINVGQVNNKQETIRENEKKQGLVQIIKQNKTPMHHTKIRN